MGIKFSVKKDELIKALKIHQCLEEFQKQGTIQPIRWDERTPRHGHDHATVRFYVGLKGRYGERTLTIDIGDLFQVDSPEIKRFHDALDKHLVPLRKEVEQILSDALAEMGYEIQ
jgi:hypothetical protein